MKLKFALAFALLAVAIALSMGCSPSPASSSSPAPEEKGIAESLASSCGLPRDSAEKAASLLAEVGCGDAEFMDGHENGAMAVARMKVNGHQVNVTFENAEVIVVEITGLDDAKASRDLYYDVDGGFVAYYDPKTDKVISWDER